ncbi:MAG: ankyrin repeat domain-containing protein [Nitrosopumilus sp.]|nr:ankyrin repeat domain-containing protein [Nitrosopumilus sp.]
MQNGDTPLITACFNGRIEVVKFLLEHGANVHAQDEVCMGRGRGSVFTVMYHTGWCNSNACELSRGPFGHCQGTALTWTSLEAVKKVSLTLWPCNLFMLPSAFS